MNDERDPLLETLFAQVERELVEDDFTAQVMAQVEKRRRNVLIGRLAIVALFVALELLLSAPLQNSVGIITQVLSTSLIEVENEWLALIFAPLNSVAGLIGMLLLGLQYLYRRMMR
ncbi:MAG: hypothetical protein OER97_04200 [Gammaproteobacteria bacterium]|nr:hypothetical protein [Gammaproteobacteria bacterium]